MRIALLSVNYPPRDTEGIARQRRILAVELVRLGHSVAVITTGDADVQRAEDGIQIFQVRPGAGTFMPDHPSLDISIARSQALFEGLKMAEKNGRFDMIDVPLWGAQGWVTQNYYSGSVAVWLQTTLPQILRIQNRPPSEAEKVKMALEQICLDRANGILGDSQSILDQIQADYSLNPNTPQGMAHLGLPPVRARVKHDFHKKTIEALVVGRLERRKGTHLLLNALPGLLEKYPHLVVRFVGRDNSQSDGMPVPYAGSFRQRYPHLAERVYFDGFVPEADLPKRYLQADMLLVPSLYESFGLIYLEAMRVGLPVVTFASGAAPEIFDHGAGSGGVLADPDQPNALATAMSGLLENPGQLGKVGQAGLERFHSAFTARHMAASTMRFYEIVASKKTPSISPQKIYQVMEGMRDGDAVSSIAINHTHVMKELGYPSAILTRYAEPAVAHFTAPRGEILNDPSTGLIFHYWGYNHSTWMLTAAHGRKALYFHNITPPYYFDVNTHTHRMTRAGYQQLPEILGYFDLMIGDSRYNLACLQPYLTRPALALPIYPVIDPAKIASLPFDSALLSHLKAGNAVNFVFISRIARNKRQDRLMEVFDLYYREINPNSHLWLVGSEGSDPLYRADLELLKLSLKSADHIHFTGRVSNPQTLSYYRAADVYLCASEHEGFGMTLAEAAALGVPVIAYAAAAVPETMGNAGVLVETWDKHHILSLVQSVIADVDVRQAIISRQLINLERFTKAEARVRFKAAVQFLRTGHPNDPLETLDPG